jgi:hypothetical protein
MGNSKLRPETVTCKDGSYSPKGGTAYLMIYNAVKTKGGLIHGKLHGCGESCAIGSFWDVNPKCALSADLIDEVAAVNDSLPNASARQRKLHVARWLRWKLAQLGMPGFKAVKAQP